MICHPKDNSHFTTLCASLMAGEARWWTQGGQVQGPEGRRGGEGAHCLRYGQVDADSAAARHGGPPARVPDLSSFTGTKTKACLCLWQRLWFHCSILIKVCVLLRNRFQEIRDVARGTLVKIMETLGLRYLHYLLKEMQSVLVKGYQVTN